MQEGHTRWEKKENHRGSFNNFTVMGFKFQNPDGEVGWHISSWESGFDPIHDFWVSGRTFHSVSIHYFYKGSPYNVIEIFAPITSGIEQAEQDAVLKAIAEWEKASAA